MVCEVCERDLSDKKFPAGSTICNDCLEKMRRLREGGGYSHSQGESINKALLRLVKAIRDQAEEDGELEEFHEYWVRRSPMSTVWTTLWEDHERTMCKENLVKDIGEGGSGDE